MMPLCAAEGIGVIPWSPLARGFLSGNRSSKGGGETNRAKTDDYARNMYYQPDDFAIVDRVAEIASRRGVSNARVALAWVLHQPGVAAPIVGVSRLEQLEDLVGAVGFELDDAELASLGDAYRPHPVLGHS